MGGAGSLLQHPSGSSITLPGLFPGAPHTFVATQDGHPLETCLVPLLHPHWQWDGAVTLAIKTIPLQTSNSTSFVMALHPQETSPEGSKALAPFSWTPPQILPFEASRHEQRGWVHASPPSHEEPCVLATIHSRDGHCMCRTIQYLYTGKLVL